MAVQELTALRMKSPCVHAGDRQVNRFSTKYSIKGNFKDLQDGDYLE